MSVTRANDFKGRLEIYSEHKLRAENLPFDIDVWYPPLKEFTYFTKFRPLTLQEGISMMAYYERRFMERKVFYQKDVDVLLKLENDLDNIIKTNFGKNGAFIRLCGRSPKDAEPLDVDNLKENYLNHLQNLHNNGLPKNANTKLTAIAKVNWMCVRNGKEAMNLLLTSERVFTDLLDWVKYGEPEQIVLREFDPSLTMDYEFRAFINNNQLNALSQYDHYAIYPHVESQKENIQKRIFEKWQQVHPHVGQSSYCMDFGYNPITDTAIVIELSPFLPCTGAALFHWKDTKDILENGPFEFRFNHQTHPQLNEIVQTNWEDRWNQKFYPYWELYEKAYPNPDNESIFYKMIKPIISYFYPPLDDKHLLFVYGTLKRNFHWNEKYLYNAKFIGSGETIEKFPLIFGDCEVPYILNIPDKGHHIKGELWEVDKISLEGMDDYEGITKGYYSRELIQISCNNSIYNANVYFKLEVSEDLLERELHSEYSLEYHKSHYQPIRHIQVKQKQYLGVIDEDHTC